MVILCLPSARSWAGIYYHAQLSAILLLAFYVSGFFLKAFLKNYCRCVQNCERLNSRSRSEDKQLRFAGLLISARKLLQVGVRGQKLRKDGDGCLDI